MKNNNKHSYYKFNYSEFRKDNFNILTKAKQCFYCCEESNILTLDHKICKKTIKYTKNKIKIHSKFNYVAACSICNSLKGQLPFNFYKKLVKNKQNRDKFKEILRKSWKIKCKFTSNEILTLKTTNRNKQKEMIISLSKKTRRARRNYIKNNMKEKI